MPLYGYPSDEIVGYALVRSNDGAKVHRYDGEKLQQLHDAVEFDLRAVR